LSSEDLDRLADLNGDAEVMKVHHWETKLDR
jgi:hypothetical protein